MSKLTNIFNPETESLDDLLIGGMRLIQPLRGYRFSIDAVLLAYFPQLIGVKEAVDLGTGHAIIPHLLSYRKPDLKIIGVEIQAEMLSRAERSVKYNSLQQRIRIIKGDIKNISEVLHPSFADIVTCNPPFWKKGSGHLSQNLEKAVARHEILVDLEQIIAAARYILIPGGKLCIIYTCDRLQEVLQLFSTQRIAANRIRFIHSCLDEKAKLFLLEGEKDGNRLPKILPPLIIYTEQGKYSQEITQMYNLIDGEDRS